MVEKGILSWSTSLDVVTKCNMNLCKEKICSFTSIIDSCSIWPLGSVSCNTKKSTQSGCVILWSVCICPCVEFVCVYMLNYRMGASRLCRVIDYLVVCCWWACSFLPRSIQTVLNLTSEKDTTQSHIIPSPSVNWCCVWSTKQQKGF